LLFLGQIIDTSDVLIGFQFALRFVTCAALAAMGMVARAIIALSRHPSI
jgi:hypothetical protein